jgi:hypothetical protein
MRLLMFGLIDWASNLLTVSKTSVEHQNLDFYSDIEVRKICLLKKTKSGKLKFREWDEQENRKVSKEFQNVEELDAYLESRADVNSWVITNNKKTIYKSCENSMDGRIITYHLEENFEEAITKSYSDAWVREIIDETGAINKRYFKKQKMLASCSVRESRWKIKCLRIFKLLLRV